MKLKLNQLVLACGLFVVSLSVHPQEIPPTVENQTATEVKQNPAEDKRKAARQQEAAMNEDPEAQRRSLTQDQAKAEESLEDGTRQTEEDGYNAREEEADLNEDPEARRRAMINEQPELENIWPAIDFYGSVRLHAINNYDPVEQKSEVSFGDGASRVGVRGEYEFAKQWWLFGRAESGFDILESFTAKSGAEDSGKGLEKRLLYAGVTSDRLTALWGKNWSSYYQIAGMADRFAIFGGNAVGVYNAGTDGGATGTGRADDVLQLKFYTSSLKAIKIKPFNLNLQFQEGQSIPHVENRNYGKSFGASAWLEGQNDFGIGLAAHRAEIDNLNDPLLVAAGISGDASAYAVSFRHFGERWYGALVFARLENVETTDTLKYIDGYGAELFTQWQIKDRWWLVAGGNWLKPENDDVDAGKYEVLYGVVGLRYTFDSFKRMLYAEYRLDGGTLVNGDKLKNEFIVGVRWDFGD